MNELTLTIVAQIGNFFIIWYMLHVFLLKKVFMVIVSDKEAQLQLEHSIQMMRQSIAQEEMRKKEEWDKFLLLFSQQIPYKGCELPQQDFTPLCPVAPGLQQAEKQQLVTETVTYLVRKIAHGQ